MKNLERWLANGAKKFDVRIKFAPYLESPYEALTPVALLSDLGGARGMLVFRPGTSIQPHASSLVEAGYGYTFLDDPRDDELPDAAGFKEMIEDWGWSTRQGSDEVGKQFPNGSANH